MKTAIAWSLVAALGLSTTATADDAQLQDTIKKLEARIADLEQKEAESAPLFEEQAEINDELEERIDEVETATLVNKIDFGLEFRSRLDSFHQESGGGVESDQSNIWSNRLRLDMFSQVDKNMKFNGRLSMYKNWSDAGEYPFTSMDPMQGRRPGDSRLYVERAYVDWTVYNGETPLTLTIGRQPSSDGPSHQFKDNTVRKATYSALSFDGAADGLIATLDLQRLSGVPDMALRLGYGKGYQANTGMSYVGDTDAINDAQVLGLFFDTGLGIDGSLMQLSVVQATDVVTNTSDLTGSSTNANVGDITLYTAMIEFTDIADTGLDLFAHGAMSHSEPNGETANMAVDSDGDGAVDMNMPMGLMTNTPGDTETKDGYAYWLGARYALPVEELNEPLIGLEYNHGTKYWFSFTQGSNDPANKLATRGNAVELYYLQPISRYAYLRAGMQQIRYDYTSSGYQVGAPLDIDSLAAANQLKALDNVYVLFNLMY